MYLDHYLSTRINVFELARQSVLDGNTFLRCAPEQVLTKFIGTRYIQLKVLHNNIQACGYVGTEKLDYSYIDHDGNWHSIPDATQVHVYVQPSDHYDRVHQAIKLLTQEAADANVIELPADPNQAGTLLITYWDIINTMRIKRKFVHVGTNPENGNLVYTR